MVLIPAHVPTPRRIPGDRVRRRGTTREEFLIHNNILPNPSLLDKECRAPLSVMRENVLEGTMLTNEAVIVAIPIRTGDTRWRTRHPIQPSCHPPVLADQPHVFIITNVSDLLQTLITQISNTSVTLRGNVTGRVSANMIMIGKLHVTTQMPYPSETRLLLI